MGSAPAGRSGEPPADASGPGWPFTAGSANGSRARAQRLFDYQRLALEAFGDVRAPAQGHPVDHAFCVLPADYLAHVGFKTVRAHARYPRLRLDLRTAVTWRGEVEAALEKLLGAVRPPRPATQPTPAPRQP